MRRLVIALLTTIALFTVGSIPWHTVAFAEVGNGNSVAAHLCQQGGYLQLQSTTGGRFATQDECVSYAAQGGSLYHPMLTVTSPITANGFGSVSQPFTITASGFPANASGTLSYFGSFGSGGSLGMRVTDANGGFSQVGRWLIGVPCDYTATWTFTTTSGVTASALQVVHGC